VPIRLRILPPVGFGWDGVSDGGTERLIRKIAIGVPF
jgi:hypothetical protein